MGETKPSQIYKGIKTRNEKPKQGGEVRGGAMLRTGQYAQAGSRPGGGE